MDARSPSRRELDGGYRVRVSKVMDPRSVSHRSWGLWLRPTWQPTTLALGTDPSVPCPSPLVLPWEGRRRRTPVGRTVGPVRPPRRNGSLGVSTPHSLSLGAADDLRGCPEGPRRDTRTQGNGLTTSSPVVSRPRTSRPRPSRWRRVRRPLLQSEEPPQRSVPGENNSRVLQRFSSQAIVYSVVSLPLPLSLRRRRSRGSRDTGPRHRPTPTLGPRGSPVVASDVAGTGRRRGRDRTGLRDGGGTGRSIGTGEGQNGA